MIETGENLGFARGNNIGIQASSGTNVLLLNSDTVISAQAVDRLLEALDRHPDVAVVGPRLVDASRPRGIVVRPDGRSLQRAPAEDPDARARARQPVITPLVERATRREQFPDWVSGACLLVRRRDAEAAGLLDTRVLYLEDVDFCAAIRARGRRVLFTPDAEVVHLRGRSAQSAPAGTSRAYRRSQLAFYEKHHPAWAPLLRLYLTALGPIQEAFEARSAGLKPCTAIWLFRLEAPHYICFMTDTTANV